jgi:NAD(P)-dependent dehydrogenase (short-subunit alcohol dehydrogenase family)
MNTLMPQTILITGTSSGIGRATVLAFAAKGWNVIATQRDVSRENELTKHPNITLHDLDVTVPDSVRTVFDFAVKTFGKLDVVVNNAGYGLDGVFEAMSDDAIVRQFDTNVFGLMRVTREAIRVMRAQGGGTIIQVSSMGGRVTFPLYSIYHSTKFAVEGFTESLHYEVSQFNIRLKLIEPGLIATEFTGRNREFVRPQNDNAYDGYLSIFNAAAEKAMKGAESPEVVAKAIVKAATDGGNRMRYPVGAPAPLITKLRKLLSDGMFFSMVKKTYGV